LTKCLDALVFQFYNKNDGIRVTDLHQGVVWGTNTAQTIRDERLINRFDYDGDYGTVLNRFLMQASLNIPLTVYGTGGQTRAFIHISDTARCIEIAINNPPKTGKSNYISSCLTH
jgi:UDP-sulfoquinovose synthase